MIRTLIVDDEPHCIHALENLVKDMEGLQVCGTAKTVDEAISLTKEQRPQLVLLDIVLGKRTGFDFLNFFLPKVEFDIIFTTAYNDYAVKAFQYSALHYLLKPIDRTDFNQALERLEEKITAQEHLDRLLSLEYNFKTNGQYRYMHIGSANFVEKVYTNDIAYVQADNNYTIFHLTNGRKKMVAKTLKFFTHLLEASHFFKISKSCIVNIEQIKTYKKQTRALTLQNNTVLQVAARRQYDFKNEVLTNKP